MKAILIALLAAAPALAQEASPGPAQSSEPICVQHEVMPGFEAWGHPDGSALAIGGRGATLRLSPATGVAYALAPARAPAAGSYGGAFPIAIAAAGTYRFALSDKAWIDLVRDGARIESGAHGHGVACSGIAKIVAFDLKPGTYIVQLSEAGAPSIAAMVVAAAAP